MQIEQPIGAVEDRAQRPGSAQLAARALAVEARCVPDPVHVLVEIARHRRIGRIEAAVGVDIGEDQRQLAARRRDASAEEMVERDGAANLIAVHQGAEHDVAPGLAAVERRHIGNAAIALGVGADIGRRNLDAVPAQRAARSISRRMNCSH